mmetsp:Transcript_26981/g.46005  ORF Transcript_26981/g.46005 Transcript_26981/m.46005 type:complete len:121 (+) Transcript_26981:89-451(+)|eukprot:CAMPEP_0183713200 /NCGR_PEP_ID=MMETSP0737-20130205/8115_1 /TAXON_ID=385413 /ORGANISM="Thalassiosira miniscula, Strain CCMP1093" /LENGTH=120 /DNA_ID=CAMNT_0025941951 /DNA_START=167 /DNA_END=529 /DNA_ORIENTATION=+
MARSFVVLPLFCMVAFLSRTSNSFTISLAPLLAARLGLGLGPWRSNYVNNFSATPSLSTNTDSSSAVMSQVKTKVGAAKSKPAVENFKFEYDDIRMLSGCKSECLELIYAKSMDRGFTSA